MEITPDLIRHLGRLSRLALTAEEEKKFEGEIRNIVSFFQKLDQLDIEGLPAMARPIAITNRLRPDEVRSSFSQEESLSVAIEKAEGQFKVPRVIE